MSSACNCCDNPHPTAPASIEVESTYAEAAKCGILNVDDGKYYRSKTVTHSYPDAPTITLTSVATQASDGSCSIETSGESDPSSEGTIVVTWGSEYTDADLIAFSDTLAGEAISGYPAYLSWPTDASINVIRSRFRLKHQPTASCYIKIWLRSRFTPEGSTVGGEDDVVTDLDPYEWSGAGSEAGSGLCLKDKTMSVDHEDNAWYGEWADIPFPTESGTTVIEAKWSYIEGFEPEWGAGNDIGMETSLPW